MLTKQSEVLQYLSDEPLLLHSGEKLRPFPVPEGDCVQYCRRMPSDSSASVHYEIMTEWDGKGRISGYRVVLHSESDTADGDYHAQKKLVSDMRGFLKGKDSYWQGNFQISTASRWLNVYCQELIPSGLSKEQFMRQAVSLMSELYSLTEPFLKDAERDCEYNPYGYDEIDENTEEKMGTLVFDVPILKESTRDADLWETDSNARVISVARLLMMNLRIPDYQRPYKWSRRNVIELLRDVEDAIESARTSTGAKHYRLGTIIVHIVRENNGDFYNVVDGQQRLLTLSLLVFCLSSASKESNLLNIPLQKDKITLKHLSRHPESRRRLHENYSAIMEYFGTRNALKQEFFKALYDLLQVVVLKVDHEDEAFQLFDSQNTRGRPLDPHDLLKAYHLRAMQMDGASDRQMRRQVLGWESVPPTLIRSLFDSYLFRIYNWARCQKTHAFSTKDIAVFKGLVNNHRGHLFPFVRRAVATGHEFQIGADFQAGECFFAFIEHYLDLRDDVNALLNETVHMDKDFEKMLRNVMRIMHCPGMSGGFKYLNDLFRCVLFCYSDRFGIENVDSRILAKLCKWTYSVMLDRDRMSERTINRYAIGESGYTNCLAMFSIIQSALLPTEIVGTPVSFAEGTSPLQRRLKKLEVLI